MSIPNICCQQLLDKKLRPDPSVQGKRITEVFASTFVSASEFCVLANCVTQRLFLAADWYVFPPTMCVMAFSGHLANAATELMKLDHEEPQLTEPYLSKQKKLMVSLCVRFAW